MDRTILSSSNKIEELIILGNSLSLIYEEISALPAEDLSNKFELIEARIDDIKCKIQELRKQKQRNMNN